ncbi:hypothetical protein [Clostridium kluyveri]|uniref:Uncharacterized protein n=2 Tax=Clostridium kluyveri TaxID=1534 RepID=A5F9N5_CLOK5|nr:hypothetical protein [Clostridium kluyveri]ABQ23625.1 hypothetical protein CKL_4026 [Clostridium kluyveri DSM 555]BAH08544.1 hypothetical protein CKR_P25 [Clostridium kluyveri NBRC 12016]
MGKIYRTIDLLKRSYDGEKFKNKFRNIRTGQEIKQGKDGLSVLNFFYIETNKNIFSDIASVSMGIDITDLLRQEWEEVQKLVTFTEAAKSELVRVEHEYIETMIKCGLLNNFERNCLQEGTHLRKILSILVDNCPNDQFKAIISNGKWYIKEAD